MRILFLHDNFPAQFGLFGQYLNSKGWGVTYGTQREGARLAGMNVFNYKPHREISQTIHPYVANFEKAVLNGQAIARAALELNKRKYVPDIVMAHSGWGPGLYAKELWPKAKYVGYFEWFYQIDAPDIVYMPDEQRQIDDILRSRSRNAAILMDLANCDVGLCPTQFQKDQFPKCFSDKLKVMHDGIDTDYFKPADGARLKLPELDLSHVDELITYVARGMEPYRGFPEFIDALPIVLKERPEAHVVIVGEDRVAYGKQLPEGESYKKRALTNMEIDWDRVHFTGLLQRSHYLQVLQASSCHVYLTIPFVLSWSMMEAMSTGCAIVCSDVATAHEISDYAPGSLRFVNMRNRKSVANGIIDTLTNKDETAAVRSKAREAILNKYSANDIYPAKEEWLRSL